MYRKNVLFLYPYFRVCVVSAPSSPKWLLTTKIPHYKVNIPPHHFFNVRAYRWTRMHDFIHQKLIQYCCFSSIIQPHYYNLVFWKTTKGLTKHNLTLALLTNLPSLPKKLHNFENSRPILYKTSVTNRSTKNSFPFFALFCHVSRFFDANTTYLSLAHTSSDTLFILNIALCTKS